MQGFLLHIHEGLQDHLRSVLDSILDWCVQCYSPQLVFIAISTITITTTTTTTTIIITATIIIIPTPGTLGLTHTCCAAWTRQVG
jgi:hypothetical protein